MERLSPKIEIINHFDNLIHRIDIDIDSSLEKYNDEQILNEIFLNWEEIISEFRKLYFEFDVTYFETFDSSKPNLQSWPKSMKVVDYFKQIRMKTIEQLKKAQEETKHSNTINSILQSDSKVN